MNNHFIQHLEKIKENNPIYVLLVEIERENKSLELITSNGSINFIGILINKENIIYSFPKHYKLNKDNNKYDIKLLFDMISNNSNSYGFNTNDKNQFPIISYINIHNYYKKNGLYFNYEKYDTVQPNGMINWLKMIRKSSKIIEKNNLILSPIIYKKHVSSLVFLSECMDYILYEAYNKYLQFIDSRFRYERKYFNNDFTNIEYIISELHKILSTTFKDTTAQLILDCINYFEWKASIGKDNFFLFVTNFDLYWQKMIHFYLNKKKLAPNYIYDDEKNVHDIELTYENNGYFESEKLFYIDSLEIRKNKIFIDHFLVTDEKLFLFDSKYLINTGELDYKQCAYYYFIKSKEKYKNKTIYTMLIFPTSKKTKIEITLNRSNIPNDNLVLLSLYLNIKEVMKCYVY